jgi:dTDP-4-dehydrorhamnose 3,5-epimerase
MEFRAARLDGVWLITPRVFEDARGFFMESYSRRMFADQGIDIEFVQDNHSLSVAAGVLRGLHFQKPPMTQAKLVRAIRGALVDVVVDLRANSPTRGRWERFELTAENKQMLFVPHGFAHGFCTTVANTEVLYKVDNFYSPQHDSGIRWDDPTLSIEWPVHDPVVSAKDAALPLYAEVTTPF